MTHMIDIYSDEGFEPVKTSSPDVSASQRLLHHDADSHTYVVLWQTPGGYLDSEGLPYSETAVIVSGEVDIGLQGAEPVTLTPGKLFHRPRGARMVLDAKGPMRMLVTAVVQPPGTGG